MSAVLRVALLAACCLALGCAEEPDRIVSSATADGRWELTLEARKNSLHRGESLAVRVRLYSLAGQPQQTFRDTIDLVANAGTVTPSRLVFSFVGVQDTAYAGAGFTTAYEDWVTYTMTSSSLQLPSGRQGEVSALFRDVEAVLKIRVIDD